MVQRHIHSATLGRNPFRRFQQPLLYIIGILFGVMVGGLVASFQFRDLITQSIASPHNAQHWGVLYNLYDYLIPYYVGFGSGAIVLFMAAVVLWFVSNPGINNRQKA